MNDAHCCRNSGLAAAQRRRVAQEVEMPAGVPGFRLPVIQIQEIQRVSAAEVVPALRLGQVGRERVGPLVAINRDSIRRGCRRR